MGAGKGTDREIVFFGNKAREDRVSCLAAQFGASWSRSRLAPAGRCDMSRKGFDDRGQGFGRREVGNKPLAIIDKTLAG
jgi:hypothetical protein